MINREIIYERNLTGSYMKIPAGMGANLDEKLMLKRKLPGLLPVEKAYVDGDGQYWYNISGKQSLDTYCRMKEIGIEFIERLIISICSEMEILEWNMIHTSCLMLDPELIFVTNSNREFIFTVYPTSSGNLENDFQQLMEFLLTKVDHKDATAVRAAYGIYEKTLADGYSIWDIRGEIMKVRQEEAKGQGIPIDHPVSGDSGVRQMTAEREKGAYQASSQTVEADRWKPEGQQFSERGNSSYRGGRGGYTAPKPENRMNQERDNPVEEKGRIKMHWKKEKSSKSGEFRPADKPEKKTFGKDSVKKERNPWMKKVKELLMEWGILEPQEENRMPVQQQKKKQPEPVVYPEEEMTVIPEPAYRPTVCLSNMGGKPRGMLLYQGNDQLEDLCVTARMTRIGQGRDADLRIDRDTISQMHARIDHEEDSYYIEDLNSTNGTFVNDEPLPYKERRKLNSNDIVRFADIRYRFC